EAAPESGILLQTPDGAGRIRFRINEVNIELGSTVYLQTQNNHILYIALLEGQALVESQGVAQYVPAGTYVEVGLDENNIAIGTPSFPRAYDADPISKLPVSLLYETIIPAVPLTPELIVEEIEEQIEAE